MDKSLLLVALIMALSISTSCDNGKAPTDGLPIIEGYGSCGEKTEKIDLCTWAYSLDAVVFGEISSVRANLEEFVKIVDGENVIESNCDGEVYPGLIVEVNVETVIYDETDSIDEASSLTLYVGHEQTQWYRPTPTTNSDGKIKWSGDGSGRIEKGQKVGFGLHYAQANQLWSVVLEPLFKVSSDGVVEFQEVKKDCSDIPPTGFGEISLPEFAETLQDCSDESKANAANREETIESNRLDSALWTGASWCEPVEEMPEGECSFDGECFGQQVCVDGVCQPAD